MHTIRCNKYHDDWYYHNRRSKVIMCACYAKYQFGYKPETIKITVSIKKFSESTKIFLNESHGFTEQSLGITQDAFDLIREVFGDDISELFFKIEAI